MAKVLSIFLISILLAFPIWAEEPSLDDLDLFAITSSAYTIGINDILKINVIKPETLESEVTVSPDGHVSFPYIGEVYVKDRTLMGVQEEIERRLSDGYMKYPVVSVALVESRSRSFFVYGEVTKPGTYPLEENMTVLRAISMAGGFTKFGSASRVKILRPRDKTAGYDPVKVNVKAVMDGTSEDDILLKSGDIVVVSEGMF